MNERKITLMTLALAILLLLGCAPFLSDEVGGNGQPVQIDMVSWQCPTPSPIPTITIMRGYWPTPERPTELPTEETWEPTVEPRIELSTPEPTATPYIRAGSDYFLGQRIQVGPVIVSATALRSVPMPGSSTESVYVVTVRVENTRPTDLEIHFELLSVIRSIKRADGRTMEGEWHPDEPAYKAAGLPYSEEGMGVFRTGTSDISVAIQAPAGQPIQWGMPFENTDELRNGGVGGGYVWWRLVQDPNCTRGPGEPGNVVDQPVGTPRTGTGGWPVAPGTTISRGYGCHSFYTGVRGPGCPASAPWWHDGVDFAAPKGTPLFAVSAMTIQYAGVDNSTMNCSHIAGSDAPHNGFGQYVKAVDDAGYTYWYGHVSSWRVSAGQRVPAAQEIAKIGSTGCSTGSHLHFRVRLNGVDRNPFDVIAEH